MFDFLPEFNEMHGVFIIIFIILLVVMFGKIPKNINPKIINAKTSKYLDSQDDVYVAIRQGIDECSNMHDMQEWYRAVMQYKKDFPDQEGQQDATILLQAYNDKSTRLLSGFRSNY